jgi:hypothetical protein
MSRLWRHRARYSRPQLHIFFCEVRYSGLQVLDLSVDTFSVPNSTGTMKHSLYRRHSTIGLFRKLAFMVPARALRTCSSLRSITLQHTVRASPWDAHHPRPELLEVLKLITCAYDSWPRSRSPRITYDLLADLAHGRLESQEATFRRGMSAKESVIYRTELLRTVQDRL